MTNRRALDGMLKRNIASLLGASLLAVAAFGSDTSDPTFVFVCPEQSSFWSTATNTTMTLPIDYPVGASIATLTVSGAGYAEKNFPNITCPSFTLTLPSPVSPQTENVYDFTLTFDDGTVRKAKLGLVQSFAMDSEGTTRCFAPTEGDLWNVVKRRAVMPIPCGTTSFTMSVNGGAVTNVDTGLNGAQGWYALKSETGDSVSLSLEAGGIDYFATLLVQGDGFFFIVK